MAMAQPRLHEHIKITKAARRKSFYHDLHISPLMIHLSYSRRSFCRGQGPNSQDVASPAGLHLFSIFEVFVKSIGVTLTEVQDVVFKLGYFERKYAFYNRTQLEQEAISHYRRQFIKQLYVFVLGLEILGNPYGLVVDLAGSVQTFFYQPFQGAIQGPDEFVEGLGIGLISLFSSSVGGLSGAAMRITGTVGKGIAALSLDDEFQRRRQEAINRQPKNIAENMARGVQGLGSGLFEGVTGVVTKPIQGARKGGVLGFFGGVGKGLIGVIVRPLTGIVDFASNTCSVIKTFATCSKPYQALRPTRFISSDGIVRPYVLYEAIGYKIFRETNKGKYADKDFFVTHAFINEEKVFIVTDR
jgi:vacuolar protein sorting-associated protein 13A/C